ncbi:MAG: 3-methyl-2-oxobutanoate dehydrogenase subunit beta [Stenotrophomonas maltophilia]|uniref:3-methyl-2-oxobutanoate dehydrogenase (2-methylpropanoyl-transferring) n=1 Tax=Stenotrophomonas maltophilia TaxID=40324 RepID=A0A7V8FH74_STEMA|nr:MAG: 3-methyl-2-oxobutanoate dehydrogenase subunit beta [Stenotrophomonas maltophilia]
MAAAAEAEQRPTLQTLQAVMAPLAPYTPAAVQAEACRVAPAAERLAQYGSEDSLPERQPPRHLAVQINQGLQELLGRYPQALLFGEDVAQKGGVYTVTKDLLRRFGPRRVFNTLLDETMILGMAQGLANLGMLPVPEIQYLAYLHNAIDQLRGEASSLQFFSNDQFRNPMLVRAAGLGYQKGFGGHFHNDNSITALRDIPGLVVGCPSRGDDAVMMLRTLAALAQVDGRVAVFLEPIALYMTKDPHAAGDGQWLFGFPEPGQALLLGEGRVYAPDADDLVVVTYGNGVPMALRVARAIQAQLGWQVRVVDLRWLVPLNAAFIAAQAATARRVLVLDEGRHSGGVGEGVVTALVEAGFGHLPLRRVCGADTYTPLAEAAMFGLPSDNAVIGAALDLAQEP